MAQIRLRIGEQLLTAVITRDAVDSLRLKRGDEALAIIKATDLVATVPSHVAASAMPGGTELTGESGLAHSARLPSRRQEAAKRNSGVTTRARTASLRQARGTSGRKRSDSVAATSAKRAMGRKSASTAVRKVK